MTGINSQQNPNMGKSFAAAGENPSSPDTINSNFRFLPAKAIFPETNVTAVLIVAFTEDGKILAIEHATRGIDIPGGHREISDPSDFETARRELMEETSTNIGHLIRCMVLESSGYEKLQSNEKSYMVVMTGVIHNVGEFVPSAEVKARHFLTTDEFINSYGGQNPEDMRFIINVAKETVSSKRGEAPDFRPVT